jgi:CheY-like chemotaxis protein
MIFTELAEMSISEGSLPEAEIQTIQKISMRASDVVKQLMVYAGNRDPDVAPLGLSGLAGEMLDILTMSIAKSAVLKTQLGANLPAVLGNRAQMQQVLMNLVLSASDSLPPQGGVITVTTSIGRPAGPRAGSFVVLDVSGSGISKDIQSRIFDPFISTKTAGRGLGLALVQGVVHTHNGSIELTSAPGQGPSFRVFWPIADQSLQPAAPATLAPNPQVDLEKAAARHVLLVEDEEPLRLSIAKILRKEGFHVLEAADGTAALQLIRDQNNDIDLVLLDMTIPGEPSRGVMMQTIRLRQNTRAASHERLQPRHGRRHPHRAASHRLSSQTLSDSRTTHAALRSAMISCQQIMLTDEEKQHILDRTQYEIQIRKELASEDKRAPWFESKLGILLLGFVLTGILVPILQYAQETIKWKRQNHFDNVKYGLTNMRDALKDFASEWAYTAEAYRQAMSYRQRKEISAADLAKFQTDETALESRIYQQHARVVAALEFFPERDEVSSALEAFQLAASDYYAALRASVEAIPVSGARKTGGAPSSPPDLETRIVDLNKKYSAVVQAMYQQIGKKQDENESFM